MKQSEMTRLFNNFMNKAESKQVEFESLNREDKVSYLLGQLEIDTDQVFITTSKEMEISKLSKDYRFQLINKAAAAGDMDLVVRLSTCQGTAVCECTETFEKAGITAQLNYLTKVYKEKYDSLPALVEVDILGGQNFIDFIAFCQQKIEEMNK